MFDEAAGDAQAAEAHLGLAQAAAEPLLPVVAHLVLCTCSSDFKLFIATLQKSGTFHGAIKPMLEARETGKNKSYRRTWR